MEVNILQSERETAMFCTLQSQTESQPGLQIYPSKKRQHLELQALLWTLVEKKLSQVFNTINVHENRNRGENIRKICHFLYLYFAIKFTPYLQFWISKFEKKRIVKSGNSPAVCHYSEKSFLTFSGLHAITWSCIKVKEVKAGQPFYVRLLLNLDGHFLKDDVCQ